MERRAEGLAARLLSRRRCSQISPNQAALAFRLQQACSARPRRLESSPSRSPDPSLASLRSSRMVELVALAREVLPHVLCPLCKQEHALVLRDDDDGVSETGGSV